jgi:hypothetical protein
VGLRRAAPPGRRGTCEGGTAIDTVATILCSPAYRERYGGDLQRHLELYAVPGDPVPVPAGAPVWPVEAISVSAVYQLGADGLQQVSTAGSGRTLERSAVASPAPGGVAFTRHPATVARQPQAVLGQAQQAAEQDEFVVWVDIDRDGFARVPVADGGTVVRDAGWLAGWLRRRDDDLGQGVPRWGGRRVRVLPLGPDGAAAAFTTELNTARLTAAAATFAALGLTV